MNLLKLLRFLSECFHTSVQPILSIPFEVLTLMLFAVLCCAGIIGSLSKGLIQYLSYSRFLVGMSETQSRAEINSLCKYLLKEIPYTTRIKTRHFTFFLLFYTKQVHQTQTKSFILKLCACFSKLPLDQKVLTFSSLIHQHTNRLFYLKKKSFN